MYKIIIDGFTIAVVNLSPETVKRYNATGITITKVDK
jgi:hypothetical protein